MDSQHKLKDSSIGSVRSYTFGFVFSIALTFLSYWVYVLHKSLGPVFPMEIAVAFLISLAVLQLFVQLIFFLHLGHESGPRWKLGIFVSTVSLILLVVVGSIWIMYHLNYNMMPPENVEEFIIEDEGISH